MIDKDRQANSLMSNLSRDQLRALAPSPYVRRFCESIVRSAGEKPVLDVACGGGRNSILLAYLGAVVIGIDVELGRAKRSLDDLSGSPLKSACNRIELVYCDLIRQPWPFKADEFGGIINVHFLYLPLLKSFSHSLVSGGVLLIETEPAHGGNYLQLPAAGVLKPTLGPGLRIVNYRERPTGPPEIGAVSVKLFARKL